MAGAGVEMAAGPWARRDGAVGDAGDPNRGAKMNAAQRKTHRAVWLLLTPLLLAFLLFARPGDAPYSAPDSAAAPAAATLPPSATSTALGRLP